MKWIFCLIGGIGGTFCGPNDISAWTSRGEDKRKQNEAVAKKKRKKRNGKKKEKKKIEKKKKEEQDLQNLRCRRVSGFFSQPFVGGEPWMKVGRGEVEK